MDLSNFRIAGVFRSDLQRGQLHGKRSEQVRPLPVLHVGDHPQVALGQSHLRQGFCSNATFMKYTLNSSVKKRLADIGFPRTKFQ